jgi:YVTN family beta-propeller protein
MKKLIAMFLISVLLVAAVCAQEVSRTAEPVIRHGHDMQTLTPRAAGSLDETWTHVDPGIAPEGDYIGGMAFTPDGTRLLVCNRMTNNVTVFDWATMQALANVSVGQYPASVVTNNDVAIVSCVFANKIYFIDLSDYSLRDSLDSGEQPWVMRFSPDSQYVYVACDISNTCEVYDISARQHVRTIENFPISLYSFSWNSASGRNDASFTDFVVDPDGEHLIASRCDSVLLFFNVTTGAVDDSIMGIRGCPALGLSGDNTKLIAVTPSQPSVAYQIDLSTHTLLDSVTITGHFLSMSYQVVVNMDGSKCFTGVDNNVSVIVRFATHDYTTISQTLTAFWIGITQDHQYAVSGQYNFCLVDFATETVVSHLTGHNQWHGVVSPSTPHVAAVDPFNYEGPCFYDITTPSNALYRGQTPSGAPPEGDAPRFVAIAPDGSKAVTSNFLSNNVSIINLTTLETETIVDAGVTPWEIAISPDSRYAVLGGNASNSVPIIDLETNTVVADVYTGGGPCVVAVSPNSDYAYVGNLSSNTVSVITLDGVNSTVVADVPCGEIGVIWASYGVGSDVEVSPSGRWVLVAASFDDQVRVIDTQTNEQVAALDVGDFPIQIAFAGNDEIAAVTNYFDNTISLLHIDGEASSVTGTYPMGTNSGPLRLAYDPAADLIGVGLYSSMQVKQISPISGAVVATHSYTQYGPVAQVAYDDAGNEIVLTSGTGTVVPQLHRGTAHTELPGAPAAFGFNPISALAAVGIPGPDFVTVVNYGTEGTAPARNVSVAQSFGITAAFPNPFNPTVTIRYALVHDATVSLRAFDALGREAATLFGGRQQSGEHEITWDASGLPSGPYWIRLEAEGAKAVKKVVMLK